MCDLNEPRLGILYVRADDILGDFLEAAHRFEPAGLVITGGKSQRNSILKSTSFSPL